MPVAVITGASRGLGAALAHELTERGWGVVVDARGAEALRAAMSTWAGAAAAVPGDVTDPAHRDRLVAAAEELGGADLLVNNASSLGSSPLTPLAETPVEVLEEVLRTNVVAPLALVRALLPQLRRNRGRVVDVSSDAAVEAYPAWGPYGASKAALDHATRVLAAEEPELRVYAVDPGDMRTRMHADAFPGEDISDRPEPATVVPALMRLVTGDLPSGRYRAADLLAAAVGASR